MKMTYSVNYNNTIKEIEVEEVGQCPLCHCATHPHCDGGHLIIKKDKSEDADGFLFLILYCTNCHEQYVACYKLKSGKYSILYTYPSRPNPIIFDEYIENLSPKFPVIYNQSKQAEETGLDELAGIGYRKSLEFLVKDYLISEQNEDRPTIEALPLGKCIDKINDPKIQTLAKGATWLGNDETHYIRKHENYNIEYMKSFIKCVVHFISDEQAVKQAGALINS